MPDYISRHILVMISLVTTLLVTTLLVTILLVDIPTKQVWKVAMLNGNAQCCALITPLFEQIRNQESQFKRLPTIKPWVTMGVIAIA